MKQSRLARILSVLLLGFSSGLPLALSASTLQAWFTVEKLDLMTIGALTLVGLPYLWKFLWAPVLDRFQIPFLDHRRGWIITLQLLIALILLAMSRYTPVNDLKALVTLAVALAFLSATQDTAINAYQTEILPSTDRGLGGATSIAGYRIAMLVSGGFAFILADHLGWSAVYVVMAVCMGVCALLTCCMPRTPDLEEYPTKLSQAVKESFKGLWEKPGIVFLMFFIVLYKIGDVFTLSFSTVFLINSLHFTLTDIGIINKILPLWTTIAGALIGGFCLTRWSLYRSLMWFGVFQTLSNLGFMSLVILPKSFLLAASVVGFENFCAGMATSAFVALLMSLCDKEYTATQYACLSALSGVARVLIGPLAGLTLEFVGWGPFYLAGFLLGFPALFILYWQRNNLARRDDKELKP